MPIKKSPHLEESLPDGGSTIQRIFVNCIIIYAFSEYVKLIFNHYTSFGGLLFMLCCFGLIILVIILEAGPAYYLFMSMMRSQSLSILQITWTVISFALVLFLCTLATLYPMRIGEKSLQIK